MEEERSSDQQPALEPALEVGGWVMGGLSESALRVVSPGPDMIEIADRKGPLLTMSIAQAAGLVDDLSAKLDEVGWER